jgi:hypothetical protein
MGRLGAVAAALFALALVAVPAPAGGQTNSPVDQAVAAFRRGDSVFIHPAAELAGRVSAADSAVMSRRIRDGDKVVFVAVLPRSVLAETGGKVNEVPELLHRRLGFAGTYAVLVGASFRAGSTDLPDAEATRLADRAYASKSARGPGPVLRAFVESVESRPRSSSPAWLAVLVVALVLLAVGGVLVLARLARRRPVVPEIPDAADAPEVVE